MKVIDNVELNTSLLSEHKTYWQNYFSAITQPFYFAQRTPFVVRDGNPSSLASQQSQGNVRNASYTLNDETYQSIKDVVRGTDSGLFVFLLSAFSVVLKKFSGQDQVIVHSPRYLHDQTVESNNGIIPLCLHPVPGQTFRDYLRQTQEVVKECYSHQDCPIQDVEIFDVESFQSNVLMRFGAIHHQVRDDHYDLILTLDTIDGQLCLSMNYAEGMYSDTFMMSMLHQMQSVLNYGGRLGETIQRISHLPEETHNRIAREFNRVVSGSSQYLSLQALFEKTSTMFPDRVAIAFGDQRMSYRELNQESNKLANYLVQTYNIRPDDVVALMVDRSERLIIAMLAILKSGAAFLPIDPELPVERRKFMLEDAAVKVVLTTADFSLSFQDCAVDLFALDLQMPLLDTSSDNRPGEDLSNALAYVIYTSGSTGLPKGCQIEHRSIVNYIEWANHHYLQGDAGNFGLFTPISFDLTLTTIFCALTSGGMLEIFDPRETVDAILAACFSKETTINVLKLTPSHITLIEKLALKSTNIECIIVGGEELTNKHIDILFDVDSEIKIFNEYGPTEATVGCVVKKIVDRHVPVAIGNPIANANVFVVDRFENMAPVGVVGEICITGVGLSRGYLNNAEMNDRKFTPNPFSEEAVLYRTGDLGFWNEAGELFFLGRSDEQVKIRGYRIECGEIENHMLRHPGVREAIVVGVKGEDEKKYLAGFFTGDTTLDDASLRNFLRSSLPDYMIPSVVVRLDEFPLTRNNKIDRKALLQWRGETLHEEPASKTERALLEIWNEVLNSKAGVRSNFFALGGDSIAAVILASRINQSLNIGVSVGDIFSYQSVRELATRVDSGIENFTNTSLQRGRAIIAQIKNEILSAGVQVPSDVEEIYPITPIENGMIYSSLLRPSEPVYYDQFVYSLALHDIGLFRKAMTVLVQRHSILRTQYYLSKYKHPVKFQLRDIALPVLVEDISLLETAQQVERIKTYSEQDLLTRLQFEGDILWHMKIFQVSPTQSVLIFSFHHALLDGWSNAVIKTELSKLLATTDFSMSTLPMLKTSYKDYCAIVLGRQTQNATLNFWRANMEDYMRNKLPFNYRGTIKRQQGSMGVLGCSVKPTTTERIVAISSKYNVSVKSIFLAAHVYMMHIACAEDDVVTGVVSHDRPPLEGSHNVAGCFLNTVPFRFKIGEVADFCSLVKAVNAQIIAIAPHEIHLSEIAKAIGERTTFSNPVFDTLMNFTEYHVLDEWKENEVIAAHVNHDEHDLTLPGDGEMTNTLLDVEVNKTGALVQVRIKYANNYFDQADMAYALNLYVSILDSMADNLYQALDPSNLLSAEERKFLLYDFNATEKKYTDEETLHGLFEQRATMCPHHPAIIQGEQIITYEELNRLSNQVAHLLIESGINPGAPVGLCMERHGLLIASALGILKAGGHYVPIEPTYPEDRRNYIITNSAISIVLSDASNVPIVGEGVRCITIDVKRLADYPDLNVGLTISSSSLAYIIYTSGSTGRPKGVVIKHTSAVNLVQWVNKTFNIGIHDRILFITSICFDLSVYDIFGILAAGASIVIATQDEVRDVKALQGLLTKYRITFWDSVPTTMNYLTVEASEAKEDFLQNDLRLVFLSGDWIPTALPDRIRKYFPNASVISLGGATEGTVWSNFFPIKEVKPEWTSIPYGKPIDNNFFYILNKNLKPVPKGTVGELYIGGIGVALGYANDAEKTRQSFMKDPFHNGLGGMMYKTGDLGRMMTDGNMEFIGRADHQVKVRGFRVELGEIEHNLLQHNMVSEAVVVAIKSDHGNNLCAYVVKDATLTIAALREFLGQRLPVYMVPLHFVVLESLPLNSSGKVDRRALPVVNETNVTEIGSTYVPPHTDVEKKISQLWEEILGLEKIGLHDNFLELGAHSLNMGAFINRLHRALDVKLDLREIFVNPTIAGISQLIDEQHKQQFSVLTPIGERPYYELSHAQRRIWIMSQFAGAAALFNMPMVYRLEGALNIEAITKAFETVIDRHQSLRTVFVIADGMPRQRVLSREALNFSIIYTNAPSDIDQAMERNATFVFDLSKGPLIRVELLKISDSSFLLLLNIHHIISDGWSTTILINEVTTLYEAFSRGEENPLTPLPNQYVDFVYWQENQIRNIREKFKLEKRETLQPIRLPYDFAIESADSFAGASEEIRFDKALTDRLVAIGIANNTTLSNVVLTIFNILMYNISGDPHINIGVVVTNRDHAALENLVGLFVNIVVIQHTISEDAEFEDTLKQLSTEVHRSLEYNHYPYDLLVEKNDDGNSSHHATINVMYGYQDFSQDAKLTHDAPVKTSNDLQMQSMSGNTGHSKFELVLNASLMPSGLQLKMEYSDRLFKKTTIKRWLSHVRKFAEQLTTP